MNQAVQHRFSRRSLLTGAAATGVAVAASSRRFPAHAGTRAANSATPTSPTTLDGTLRIGVESGLAGIALYAERNGEAIVDASAGLADREQQTTVTTSDRFRIASITKTFTAVRILQIVDAGVVSLDDTVTQWLDDPAVARIPYIDAITIRQLLNHTSGIYDYFDGNSPFWQDAYFGPDADWSRVWTPSELLAYAAGDRHAPYFAPGEGAHYTNTGYILLGLIAEAGDGRPFVAQLRDEVLDPLGLADTFLDASEPVPGDYVTPYHLIDGEIIDVSTINLSAVWTAGAMVSTTRDLARFLDALLGGELLQPATLAAMTAFAPPSFKGAEAGLGLLRLEGPSGILIGHSGDGPGSAGRLYRMTDTGITVVLLSNTGGVESAVDTVFSSVQELLG